MTLRSLSSALVALALGCNSVGSEALPGEAGADATLDATSDEDADAHDAGDELSPSTCLDIDAALPSSSPDCVYGGHCSASCASGTASSYLCNAGMDGAASYPSVFTLPSDSVDIIGYQPDVYPWDGGAFVVCAGLSCTRWATADHVDGGSAWGGDPCAEGGVATQAWACPTSPGVLPTPAGCFNPGDVQRIGGTGTGIPINNVWCCPPTGAGGADAGGEGGDDAGLDAGNAASD